MGNQTGGEGENRWKEVEGAKLKAAVEERGVRIALLGDSTLDNGGWTGGGPAVIEQVREYEGGAAMLARDGALIAAVRGQAERVSAETTHVVLSVGGNNALDSSPVLGKACGQVQEALLLLYEVVRAFEQEYAAAVALVRARHPAKQLVLCSLYAPCFGPYVPKIDQRAANLLVALFADVVCRVAAAHSLPVVDLRRVLHSIDDFANPIEPSSVGGRKLAAAIVDAIVHHSPSHPSIVYPRHLSSHLDILSTFVSSSIDSASSSSTATTTATTATIDSTSTPPPSIDPTTIPLPAEHFGGGDAFRGNQQK